MCIYETRDLEFNLLFLKKHIIRCFLKLTFLLLFILPRLESAAQFYEFGQDAGSIRWNHFSSSHYQLIYPQGLDSLAMEFADKLEYFYPHQAEYLNHRHDKMPVIFHNESSFSNGIFVWAPKRLEIYTNPDPNGYPQDWMTQLALHEGRHAVQVSKLRQGAGKFLSYIAGEQAVGLITGFLPVWYLEGDAVDAETRFSTTGRGRLPSFEMGMKALLLEKEQRYTFSKAALGSYKDYVPNHYQLGYLMVRYGRRTYGENFWPDMEDYTAQRPFTLNPGYFSMKKYGIESKRALYNSSLDLYYDHWKKSLESRHIQSNIRWSSATKIYTSYNFPQWQNDSVLLALKSGLDQIPEFVSIDSAGAEKLIFRPGYLNSGRFSYNEGKIIWDEWVPDFRWSNRSFSVLRIFDIENSKVRNLGSRTRYYSPAFSKNGKRIAAIEQRSDHTFHLVVLDLEGNILNSIKSPKDQFIQHPEWMGNDSAIVVSLNKLSGEYLYTYSFESDSWREIFHAGYNDISYPVVSDSEVYFSSTFSGIDNIFSFNMRSGQLNRLTFSEFGAFEPSVSRSRSELLFADYHSDGYRAVSVMINAKPYEISVKDLPEEQLDAQQTNKEKSISDSIAFIRKGSYQVKKYRKLAHSLNIHSWLPLYFDYMNPEAALTPEEFPLRPGVTLLTQNLLSTVNGMLGYEYKDKTHYLHSGLRLKGKYPIFDLSMNYGGLPLIHEVNEAGFVSLRPDRLTFNANTYVPFRLNTGKYISFFQPYFGYTYTSDLLPSEDRDSYVSGIHKMHYRLFYTSYLLRGKRDILPRLGFSVSAGFRNAPFNAYNFGSLSYAGATFYVPGILKHQSVRLRLSSQVQDPVNYFLRNSIPVPRGIQSINGLNMKFYSLDYTFPLGYPDWNIESFVYIKRIRANIWMDYLQGKDIYIKEPEPAVEDINYHSFGADLIFDFHPFRIYFPFSMGMRSSYVPATQKIIPEFLFTIDVK